MTTHTPQSSSRVLHAAVIVAALGYFVDIYDLVLFSVTRVQSLTDIGVPPEQIADIGSELLGYWQMLGMLVGGILHGILLQHTAFYPFPPKEKVLGHRHFRQQIQFLMDDGNA